MDNDDAITKTALEELYTIAKKFQADVVHCEKFLQVATKDNLLGRKDYSVITYNSSNIVTVTEPTLISENIADRVVHLQNRQFMWTLWSKLIRRDFFVENGIEMQDMFGEDVLCTICLACSAKRYVKVPNVVNIYRVVDDSLSHKAKSPEKFFGDWTRAIFQGISYLDKFLNGQKFFQQNPDAKYVVFDCLTMECIMFYLSQFYAQVPAPQLDVLIRQEFSKIENFEAVAAFIFSRMNIFQLNLNQQAQTIQNLQKQIQQLQGKS